ncbi:glyoxalase [Arenibacter sp. 6A1]|uniref:glyoxalase n=1 Tax=Arenibacter sp. 6A1 TaxID=2720391 RepID=UPI001444FF8A|nr:glyoxalase [Arenibacter sp. 6A1]NKI24988.1 glyoxalase [Arenibacter sp. 6A1]
MSDRSLRILEIRPLIPSAKVSENMSIEEQFQNKTLRPVLKMQNSLLLVVFKNYIEKHKNRYYELNLSKRMLYIENAIQKDIKFRNSLKGIIIGQFTTEEYALYTKSSSALNKRMMQMVTERIKDQLQYFETSVLL